MNVSKTVEAGNGESQSHNTGNKDITATAQSFEGKKMQCVGNGGENLMHMFGIYNNLTCSL